MALKKGTRVRVISAKPIRQDLLGQEGTVVEDDRNWSDLNLVEMSEPENEQLLFGDRDLKEIRR